LRWLADENFTNDILRALFRRQPALDILRVQDVGLKGVDDKTVLEWAAAEHRVVLTHDVSTVPAYAYDRVRNGRSMAGVCAVGRDVTLQVAIEDILLISACSDATELEGQVRYLPLR